uniref:Uncharacterized protein n=1 Tax=Rhizophora mucronata TaxID=61149 RepID=A0A2P2PF79_RHIMU
MAFSEPDFTEL